VCLLSEAECGGGWEALSAERPVACFCDLQSCDFERFAKHGLGGPSDESEADQLYQLIGLEAVNAHDPFGAAFRAATDEQREGAALIGLKWSRVGLSLLTDLTEGQRSGCPLWRELMALNR
jgi:hypothetical protein